MKETSQNQYMPQLDGIRALAVSLVLIQHWGGGHLSFSGIPIGGFGVGMFLVLSGFLITGILLQYRAVHNGTTYFNLRQFWIRRILRIFPLFYATLVVGCFFQVPGVIDYRKWQAAYLTNVLIFVNGEMESLHYSVHFWTLAVEEQFYLLWPIVVFFLPSRHLPLAICFTLVTAPVWRSGLFGSTQMAWGLLQNQLDYLGIGAMLACAK